MTTRRSGSTRAARSRPARRCRPRLPSPDLDAKGEKVSDPEGLTLAVLPAERAAPLEIALRVDELPVALDVAVLAADHEYDEIVALACIREPARHRRLDVHQTALAELARLVGDLEACSTAVDEVQLVLLLMEMAEALEARRHHDHVGAERRDSECAPNLAEAVALADVVERAERIAAHSRRTISSASSRVNARSVSVCSAP